MSTRRTAGLIPATLGLLLLILAALLPSVIRPALQKVPGDPDITTTLIARGAEVLDVDSQQVVTEDLTLTTTTTGRAGGGLEHAPDGVVQWQTLAQIANTAGVLRSTTWDVQAFDGRTGKASPCCAGFQIASTGDSVPANATGIVLKYPFDTPKRDQVVWDSVLRATVAARFEGVEKVDGVTAYRFETSVPRTKVDTSLIPASLLGLRTARDVLADLYYEGGRAVWVEPNTGGVLDVRQRVKQTLETSGTSVVGLDATFQLSAQSRAENVGMLRRGVQLGRMRVLYPAVVAALGLALILLGSWRRRRARPEPIADSDSSLVR